MVKMTVLDAMEAKNPEAWSEPARARAVDLVMIGHLLEGRLAREGVTNAAGFAKVWRDHLVPVAATNVEE